MISELVLNKILQLNDEFEAQRTQIHNIITQNQSKQIEKLCSVAKNIVSIEEVDKLIQETINSVVLSMNDDGINEFNDKVRDIKAFHLRTNINSFVSKINKQILFELRKLIRGEINKQSKNNDEQLKELLRANITDNKDYLEKGYLDSSSLIDIYNVCAIGLGYKRVEKINTLTRSKVFKDVMEIERIKEGKNKAERRYKLKSE